MLALANMASGWLMAWLVLLASLHTSIARPYILFANRKDIRLLEITNNKARFDIKTQNPLYGLDDAFCKFWLRVKEVLTEMGL